MIKSVFIRNFLNLSLNQGVNILVAIIATPILFKNLGESQYGLVNLSFSIVLILSIIVSYGYHLNGPKRISLLHSIEEKKELINQIISLRISLALIISVFILLFSYYTILFKGYEIILMFSVVILFSEALNPVFYLQGEDNLFLLALTNATSKLLYLLLIIFLVISPDDSYIVNFLFGTSLTLVYVIFWIYIYIKNKIIFKWPNIENLRFRIKENFKFFLSSFAGHISIHSGIIILSLFSNNSELGKFALAHRVAILLRMIPIFIIQSALQKASLINENKKSFLDKYLNYYYYRGLVLTFFVAIATSLSSKWIIIFLSGEQIDYSQEVLVLLSFVPFLGMLNSKNILKILVNENKEILNKATWISAFIMIVVSLILSYYHGGKGLAIALLFSELASFIVHSILLNNDNK